MNSSGLRFGRSPDRSSGTSKLLDKVSKQLRGNYGTRGSFSSDLDGSGDDELEGVSSYLKKLSERTSRQSQSGNFSEESDDESKSAKVEPPLSAAASRFLKKSSPAAPSVEQPSTAKSSNKLGRVTNSPVLNKAAKFTAKYGKTGRSSGVAAETSNSDIDLNMSMDEDVLADVREMKKNRPSSSFDFSGQSKTAAKISPKSKKSSSKNSDDEDDSNSMKIGKSGNKFLKKPAPSTDIKEAEKPSETTSRTKKESSSVFKSANAEILLDDEEESLADFIGALSEGSSGRRTPSKSKDSSKIVSRSGFESDDRSEKKRINDVDADVFHFNARDAESLEDARQTEPSGNLSPSTRQTVQKMKSPRPQEIGRKTGSRKKTKGSNEDVFHLIGLQSIDDLQDLIDPLPISEIYESDYEAAPSTARGVSPMPLRSILSPTPRSMTPRSSRSRVRLMDELTEIRSRSPSPETPSSHRSYGVKTETVHTDTDSEVERTIKTIEESSDEDDTEENSTIKTLSDASSVSSFDRMSTTRRSHRRIQRRSSTSSRRSSMSSRRSSMSSRRSSTASERYYSDDFTKSSVATSESQSTSRRSSYTEDTESQRSSPRSSPRFVVDTKDSGVQTGLDIGLHFHWVNDTVKEAWTDAKYRQAFAEPSSVGTSVVNADALSALTNFSPASFALNDLMSQQLLLTNQLRSIHQRLHFGVIQSLNSSFYKYTTLKDTKEYIRRHAKPLPSFEETLRQVKDEMGLSA